MLQRHSLSLIQASSPIAFCLQSLQEHQRRPIPTPSQESVAALALSLQEEEGWGALAETVQTGDCKALVRHSLPPLKLWRFARRLH